MYRDVSQLQAQLMQQKVQLQGNDKQARAALALAKKEDREASQVATADKIVRTLSADTMKPAGLIQVLRFAL